MSKKANNTQENPIELYFTWYLDELKHHGFIKYYDREPEMIEVLPPYEYNREKHFKTKENELEAFNLLPPINYTYDFRIVWEREAAMYIFTEPFESKGRFLFGAPTFISHYIRLHGDLELVSYVDVKPHASAAQFNSGMSSFYTFPLIQKFLLATRGLFINKAIPTPQGNYGINTCLFAQTFMPNRYGFTDAGQQLRKIKFKKTSLNHYVNSRRSTVESLLKDIENKKVKNNQQTLL